MNAVTATSRRSMLRGAAALAGLAATSSWAAETA